MLSGLHFLLTYVCLYECDHCFLYCGPRSQGTFTLEKLTRSLDQAVEAGVSSVYFEGGEPFLYYPVLLEALRLSRERNLEAGLVTNAYWATTEEDAELWLKPLVDLGISDLSISEDTFHSEDPKRSPARIARAAAERLGLPVAAICIDPPKPAPASSTDGTGAVIGGDVLFKGRAADRLTEGLPMRAFEHFDECPHEELAEPGRVHLDPFGDVFVCQGISIGNIWRKPLKELMADYRPEEHPIVGPLLRGGPAELARQYGLPDEQAFADHCHLCFLTRRKLLERFPEQLCPSQVYESS
jgi:hypothetical protein